jgi:hypothetical protein
MVGIQLELDTSLEHEQSSGDQANGQGFDVAMRRRRGASLAGHQLYVFSESWVLTEQVEGGAGEVAFGSRGGAGAAERCC